MRCYTIVRHIFGHKYHRNTLRNRIKAYDRGGSAGPRREGDESFMLYVGACVKLWNKERRDGNRRVTYYDLFNKQEAAPRGQPYRYPYVPKAIRQALLNSKFPPPLLAVACCDTVPLNLLARGERYSFSKLAFGDMVRRLAEKPGAIRAAIEISNAHFRGESLGKTRNVSSLIRPGCSDEEATRQYAAFLEAVQDYNPQDHADEMDARLGWSEPGKVDPRPVPPRAARAEKVRVPGTKVHNIDFHGGFRISRRMASYWRGKGSKARGAEYLRCCEFIRSLLQRPWPTAPSTEGMASTVPIFNALLNISMKRKPAVLPRGGV